MAPGTLVMATFFTPRDEPVGTVSILSAIGVLVTLGILLRNPDRLSNSIRNLVAIMTALLLPAGVWVLGLPREGPHHGGIDRAEALASYFILLSGAFGAGLGCTRSNKQWLILEGLIVSILAGLAIILVAVDFGLILVRPDTPALTAATIALVLAAFGFRLGGLILRLRRQAGAREDESSR